MAWTRERGTRRLVFSFIGLIILWLIVARVQDHFLLQRSWPRLQARPAGLSVVGTLDPRDSLGRNLFIVVQANQSARVELTDFGWRSIFDPRNGPLFRDRSGNAIKAARDVDDRLADAMLEPFLRAAIAHLMGAANWKASIRPDTVILVPRAPRDTTFVQTTLGAQIDRFEGVAANDSGANTTGDDSESGGGSGGREVEHGMAIPASLLIRVCPVVLTDREFTGATVDEHPASVLAGATYTVHLDMSDEGRSRFFQWSHDHVGENLVFVLKDNVVAAGRVKQSLNVSDYEIGPLRDGAAAHALADYLSHAR